MNAEAENRIRELHDKYGEITPRIVVEDAQNPDSPLHGEFDWDLEKAAWAHWEDCARLLIRKVNFKIVRRKNSIPTEVIAYVRDPDKPAREQGYVSTIVVQNDKDKARRVVAQECERAMRGLERVYKVAEAVSISGSEVESIMARIRGIRDAI